MRVSVVIPTLNEEKYIEQNMIFLRHQSRPPLEIIVSDGKSSDRTRGIARRLGAKVVMGGDSVALGRNRGAACARGDVVLFLDADNIAYPNLIQTIAADFRKNRRLALWTCRVFAFTPNETHQQIYRISNDIVKLLIKTPRPHCPGIVMGVRRSLFEKVGGFDEKLKTMEDHDLAFRLSGVGDTHFSDESCVFTSTRRISKIGTLNLLKTYAQSYLSYIEGTDVKYPPIR